MSLIIHNIYMYYICLLFLFFLLLVLYEVAHSLLSPKTLKINKNTQWAELVVGNGLLVQIICVP